MAFVLREAPGLSALWQTFRRVQPLWVLAAMSMHGFMVAVSVWRWHLLLDAQHVRIPARRLTESFWVALFFNNFLPSNIGGDVVRIADTSKPAGWRALATMVILVDRVLGLFALLSVGAIGAMGAQSIGVDIPGTIWIEVGALAALAGCLLLFFAPGLLNLVLLRPVRALGHPWVLERLETLQRTLARFRERPSALAGALLGAVLVQGVIVAFYALTARSLSGAAATRHGGRAGAGGAGAADGAGLDQRLRGARSRVSFFFARFGLGVEAAVAVSLLGRRARRCVLARRWRPVPASQALTSWMAAAGRAVAHLSSPVPTCKVLCSPCR